MKRIYVLSLLSAVAAVALAQEPDSIRMEFSLDNVAVTTASRGKQKMKITNTEVIGQGELIRAACCNLGESFTTNPSVDVAYSDAATGARQIKLLGLSGTYVQMLTENMPNLRGASIPYSLGYVPGPWLQSIQVSKGASSVKNGYESITGQINIEYLKPQGVDGVRANAYLDTDLKQEVNLDGGIHLTDRLSTSALLHFENRQTDHDKDKDGFMDMPKIRQFNGMWRWAYVSPLWISQFSFKGLRDERNSGMSSHNENNKITNQQNNLHHYGISVRTNRYEAQWKNGFTLNSDHNTSVALMLNGAIHDASNQFGHTTYDVKQKTGYAQLMFETDFTPEHNISIGASFNHDGYDEDFNNGKQGDPLPSGWLGQDIENTYGFYAQYTYKLGETLTIMPGIRWDNSSVYGSFWTPRLHLRYSPNEVITLRASAGKGYRSPHALAENVSLLASSRDIVIEGPLNQEEAWNYGASASFTIPVGSKSLELNADYYYTNFKNQMVINPSSKKYTNAFVFSNLDGESYSHTLQIDATYPFFEGFTATGAYRYTDARTTYDGELKLRPLTSRYKALLTLGYITPLEFWHFDVTGSLNGSGKLYDGSDYPAYFQLQAQVTYDFRHFSVYVGGENLTNYTIDNPILGASNPWAEGFDATQVWGPTNGAMGYIGIRYKFEKQ